MGSSDKILHKSTVHVKMEAQCFLCTQELPFGFLMVCQNCGIFQILVQDMVKTCVRNFVAFPKISLRHGTFFTKNRKSKVRLDVAFKGKKLGNCPESKPLPRTATWTCPLTRL